MRRAGNQSVCGTLGLTEFAKRRGALSKEEALSIIEGIPKTGLYTDPGTARKKPKPG